VIYVVGMAPLMMHHAYTNYGGGGSNIQQIQAPPQQLQHIPHQIQQWNNSLQKRSKYQKINQNLRKIKKKERQRKPLSSAP